MVSRILLLLALVSLLLPVSTERAEGTPIMLTDPSSLNVSVNAWATFSCQVSNADMVWWLANGSNLDNLEGPTDKRRMMINPITSKYSISIFVREKFQLLLNNTEITCVALTLERPFSVTESKAAELKVQGVLDSPTYICVDISTDAISLSWLPPYTMDGIKIKDYEVKVTVHNPRGITDQQEITALHEETTIPLINQSACTVYDISVQARSDGGLGHPEIIHTLGKYELPRKLRASQIGAVVNFFEDRIIMWFTFEQDYCAGRQVDFVSATVIYSTNLTATNFLPAVVNDKGRISIDVTIPKSARGSEVWTIIALSNSIGSVASEPKLTALASTEEVIFTYEKAIASFQCSFTESSYAKGCYIVLRCRMDSTLTLTFNLSAQKNSYTSEAGNIDCTVNMCTAYDVSAFDITNDGSIGALAWSRTNLNLCSLTSRFHIIIALIFWLLVLLACILCCAICKQKFNHLEIMPTLKIKVASKSMKITDDAHEPN